MGQTHEHDTQCMIFLTVFTLTDSDQSAARGSVRREQQTALGSVSMASGEASCVCRGETRMDSVGEVTAACMYGRETRMGGGWE